MKKIFFNNKTVANTFNIFLIIYLLIFFIFPLQLLFLFPNSTLGLFFKENFVLSIITIFPVLIYFYLGVFYNYIKIDSYIINISSNRLNSSLSNFNDLLDIKHDMLKSFYFKNNFLSWNTILFINFKNDKSKLITKKISLTLLSRNNKLKLENSFNKILKI